MTGFKAFSLSIIHVKYIPDRTIFHRSKGRKLRFSLQFARWHAAVADREKIMI
jgi:hypothetical protein